MAESHVINELFIGSAESATQKRKPVEKVFSNLEEFCKSDEKGYRAAEQVSITIRFHHKSSAIMQKVATSFLLKQIPNNLLRD